MELVQVTNFSNKFSDNILPTTAIFSDEKTVVNITTGTGGISFFRNGLYGYYFGILNADFDSTDLTFNFGDALTTTITEAGIYRFQLSIFDVDSVPNSFIPFDFEVLVYKNGVYSETLEGTFDFDAAIYSNNMVTFAQEIVCDNLVTDLDFAFVIKHDATSPVANTSFQFCNLKLELDNKFSNTVTPYSLPFGYLISTQDVIYGNIEVVTDGLETVFNIPHGMGVVPSSFNLEFGDATDLNLTQSVRTIDDTNITITCTIPPVTSSQTVYWQVFR